MKLLYVTRQVPYGDNEGFILPEIENHIAAGWDVFVCPLYGHQLIHQVGRDVLDKTLDGALISPRICAGALAQFLDTPGPALRTLWAVLKHSHIKLLPRNLAAWPKGLWLGRQIRQLGIQHIHVHWIAVTATMGFIAATIAKVPWSITAHRYDIAQNNLLSIKFEASTFIRAIDESGARELVEQTARASHRPIILRMGVSVPHRPALSTDSGQIRGIIGARLAEKKGHHYLLDALALARRSGTLVYIDAFGDGPLETQLRQQAEQLGTSDLINWRGSVGHETLLDRIQSGDYDFAILPSVTAADGDKEGIPVFLMEAMAAGLPVITTPNGGIRELVTPGSGLLVPEKDSEAIAAAMMRLSNSPSERQTMGNLARARIIEEFSIEARMAELRALIAGTIPSEAEDCRKI